MGVGVNFFYEIQPDLGGRGHKNYFSGHGHVEYQIKGDEQDTLNNFNLRSNW